MVTTKEGLFGLYFGSPEDAWSSAADLSAQIHVTYMDRSFDSILAVAPKMYDDIWTAGKCMYKTEPIVSDGGELIIYAPHVTEISYTHGKILDDVGYHTRDYFLGQWERFKGYHLGRTGPLDPRSRHRDVLRRRGELPRQGYAGYGDPRKPLPEGQPGLP